MQLLWSILALLALCSSGAAQETQLQRFLQQYVTATIDIPEVSDTRYVAKFVHLRDDGAQQIIVYLIGPAWCGSSGSAPFVLIPSHSSYQIVTEISIVWLPIRVLDTKSHGWHDLGVWVRGGGIQARYEARLSFDGEQYPNNPTMPPSPAPSQRHQRENCGAKSLYGKTAVRVAKRKNGRGLTAAIRSVCTRSR